MGGSLAASLQTQVLQLDLKTSQHSKNSCQPRNMVSPTDVILGASPAEISDSNTELSTTVVLKYSCQHKKLKEVCSLQTLGAIMPPN